MFVRSISAATVAVLALAADASAQGYRSRSDALFEPWRAPAFRGRNGGIETPPRPQRRSDRSVSPSQTALGDLEQPDLDSRLPAHLQRRVVAYSTDETAGTIIVDTANTYLYLVLGHGQALRYGIGVGREGFTWAGRERVTRMAEWPDWRPPNEMLQRSPGLPDFMPGGLDNPLGARALYLGNTLYRIHGTNEPSTIGRFVSSGCIRMRNQDVMDLYRRVSIGTRVVVLDSAMRQ